MAGKREKKVDLKKKEIEELVSLYAQITRTISLDLFFHTRQHACYLSTCVLPLKEFNVDFFLNVFEKHMQSNKSLTANGRETEVTIQSFPSGYNKNNKKNQKNKKKIINI